MSPTIDLGSDFVKEFRAFLKSKNMVGLRSGFGRAPQLCKECRDTVEIRRPVAFQLARESVQVKTYHAFAELQEVTTLTDHLPDNVQIPPRPLERNPLGAVSTVAFCGLHAPLDSGVRYRFLTHKIVDTQWFWRALKQEGYKGWLDLSTIPPDRAESIIAMAALCRMNEEAK